MRWQRILLDMLYVMKKGVYLPLMNQNTQEPLEEFCTVIQELTELSDSIYRVEQAKAEAASERKHHLLDGCIQREQAYILKLRGLEQKRIQLSKTLGWEGLTFRKILEKVSPQEKTQLQPLFTNLEQTLKKLDQSRKASEQIINVRVHELQVAIAQRQGTSYDNAGNIDLNSPVLSKMKNRYV